MQLLEAEEEGDELAQDEEGDATTYGAEPAKVAKLTSLLASRVTKDPVPYGTLAKDIQALAARVVAAGKELHILLTGCNTQNLMQSLLSTLPADQHPHVWVLCTSFVWPSDLATFLWHHYGSLARPGDLDAFRSATRKLLGEYTLHYQRQRIRDESMREARAGAAQFETSLANCVFMDRLDKVAVAPGGEVRMAML